LIYICCLQSNYMVSTLTKIIGENLTPFLLVTIVALIIRSISLYFGIDSAPLGEEFNTESPFSVGFTEGYLTMDAIAAIAFSMVVLNSIRDLGVNNRKDLLIGTVKSASIAAVLLGVIYVSLGWIGNKVNLTPEEIGDQNSGTFILTFVSDLAYGQFG